MNPSQHNDDGQPRPRGRLRATRKRTALEAAALRAQAPNAELRVWIVDPDGATAARLEPILEPMGLHVERLCAFDTLDAHLKRRPPIEHATLVILAESTNPADALHRLTADHPAAVALLAAASPTLELAVEAMRLGAADLITTGDPDDAISDALRAAVARAAASHKRETRVERLRGVCRRLNEARQQITSQVSGMCNDLVDAYQELSGQIDTLSLCAEFNGVVRQELDIENLLRVALEFVLAKTGPTNAAVFLPATTHEFSLGAYVNCDLPADSVEPLLDHLADTLAPRFEHRPGVHVFANRRETAMLLDGDQHWLDDRAMVVFPCYQDDECLAVVSLFRDDRQPFDAETLAVLDVVSSLFAAQLSRVIHVHHRHLPKHQWGLLGESAEDETEDGTGWAEDDLDQAA